jgi:lysine-N-methylase
MPNKFFALRYMDGFSCLGPECEDNCCGNWTIYIDQGTHSRLKKVMAKDGTFEQLFQLLPPAQRTKEQFSYIAPAEGDMCPMLTKEGWCSLHQRFGEELLPSVCSIFPRHIGIIGGRAELTGFLSCPEIARRALLHEGAVDVVEVDPKLFGGMRRTRAQSNEFPFEVPLDELRGTLYQLFGMQQYPLASRFYFAVDLAERLSQFFHRDTEEIDFDRFVAEIKRIEDPTTLDVLHHQFAAQSFEGPLAISTVAQALAARLTGGRGAQIKQLAQTVFAQYATTCSGVRPGADEHWKLSPEPLWADYHARWERIKRAFPDRVELWLGNFAQLEAIHEWYSDWPSLLVYIRSLALRMALVRFMLAAHPLASEAVEKKDSSLADRALVEIVYHVARSFEHSPSFYEALSRALHDAMGPPATIALIKL